MNGTIKLRNYDLSDRDSTIRIFRSNMPRYFRDHELPEFLNFLDSSGCPYFVVTAREVVVACGGFGIHEGSRVADLCWGMVESTWHKNRIGEFLLLGRLYKISYEKEVEQVRLGTCQITEGFFHRYGFKTESHSTNGLAEGLDDVQMKMELSEENCTLIRQQWHGIIS